MNATKHTTKIIISEDQIPPGFVPVTTFRTKTASHHWPTVAKAISEAHQHGRIRAVKLCRTMGDLKVGPVFVHEADCTEYLQTRYASPKAAPVEASLDTADLLAAIERLTSVVEDLTAAMRLRAEAEMEGEACTG